jgi:serine protease Do
MTSRFRSTLVRSWTSLALAAWLSLFAGGFGASAIAQENAGAATLIAEPVAAPIASDAAAASTELAQDPPIDLPALFKGELEPTAAGLRAMQGRMKELVAKLTPSVVGVQVGPSQGSGVVVDKDGTVLTAAHVNGKKDLGVVFLFADESTKRGKTLGSNKRVDGGMMKIETELENLVPVELGDSDELKPGQWVVALGHPGGYDPKRKPVLRLGRVLSVSRSTIVTDCTLVGGDSGGPLFDMDGKLIGIHSRIGGSIASNMHVPVNTFTDSWDRLAASQEWGDGEGGPFIGVRGAKNVDNALLDSVYPGSPAEQAGMKGGDVIVEFDGKPVKNFADLSAAVEKTEPGDEVSVKVQRGEETVELKMTIGKKG